MTSNTVSIWVAELNIWPLVVVILPNLLFRRYGPRSFDKRKANLFQALTVFAITTSAAFVASRELTDIYFYTATVVVVIIVVIFRKNIFPYRLTCVECDAKLDYQTIYFRDDNLCKSCHSAKEAREDAEAAGEEMESTGTTEATGNDEDYSWPGSQASSDESDDSDDPA